MKISFDFLCIDERDSPNLTELYSKTRREIKEITNKRFFGICGVIIPGATYPELNIKGRKIQERCFGKEKYHPLHYVDILNNSGNYAFLGTDAHKRRSVIDQLNNLVKDTKYKIIATFIDKQKLALKYGIFTGRSLSRIQKIRPNITKEVTPRNLNLYDIALKFILQSYYEYLKEHNRRGLIIAEARGEKEDTNLLNAFYQYQKTGTGSLSGRELRSYITDLLIIRKSQNHLGTQLADLITYPLYDNLVPDHRVRKDHVVHFSNFKKKIKNVKIFP